MLAQSSKAEHLKKIKKKHYGAIANCRPTCLYQRYLPTRQNKETGEKNKTRKGPMAVEVGV